MYLRLTASQPLEASRLLIGREVGWLLIGGLGHEGNPTFHPLTEMSEYLDFPSSPGSPPLQREPTNSFTLKLCSVRYSSWEHIALLQNCIIPKSKSIYMQYAYTLHTYLLRPVCATKLVLSIFQAFNLSEGTQILSGFMVKVVSQFVFNYKGKSLCKAEYHTGNRKYILHCSRRFLQEV